ncbi:MAG: hypothetical protein OEU76_04460 [Cyclobacteriaceae bacterium]|nr:hypothetical protein [Cyclobacteriaceae bacterium]
MSLIKVLYISALIFLKPDSPPDFSNSQNCDNLVVTSTVTIDSEKGGKVQIEVKGGKAPYKYVFYKESGHLVSTKYDNNWVEGLKNGKYSCTVADKDNCKKTIDFEIR